MTKCEVIDLTPSDSGSAISVHRVSDRYSDTTNNRTLMREEISCAENWLYYGNEG